MHPATEELLKFFKHDHLTPELREVAKPVSDLARKMALESPENAETTAGMRKLLEAKDCFIRARLG